MSGRLEARLRRWRRPAIAGLALGGAIIGIGSTLWGFAIGMWPPHDTSAYWLAGRHLLAGEPVYGGSPWFHAFVYAPPLAVLMAPLSLLPIHVFSAALVALQVAALRYITGSWTLTCMLGWIPWVHYEFVAGNVDCLIAATMYGSLRGGRGSGSAVALCALAKLSPALVLVRASRRQWIEVTVALIVLVALTLPVLHLWPEWLDRLGNRTDITGIVPLMVRLPIAGLLIAYRRPWSVAAGTALATPVFYRQSIILLLPALRLWWEAREGTAASVRPRRGLVDPGDSLASSAA